MADGKLKCSGSTFFLKKHFGTGYHLICAKGIQCNSIKVTKLLRKYIPDIQVERDSGNELFYLLPKEKKHLFGSIFEDLENNERLLSMNGFGVALTTLEEIFVNTTLQSRSHLNREEIAVNEYLLHGPLLLLNQTAALLRKRFHCWFRALPWFCFQNIDIILTMMTLNSLFDSETVPKLENLPSLVINFDKYKSPLVVLQNTSESV